MSMTSGGSGGGPVDAGGARGEGGAPACAGSTCCAEPCRTCEQCSGADGTCVPVPVGQIDEDPAGACVGESSCDGTGRCSPRTQIAAGYAETCVLLGDGSVRCWGRRYVTPGQWETIGDDETPARVDPLPLSRDVVQLAAGRQFMCALFSGGAGRKTFEVQN